MASIKFDSTELVNTTYIPRTIKHETIPQRYQSLLQMSGDDGAILVSSRYGEKIITINGILTGTSEANLEANIDSFKELFSRENKNLDISWNSSTRRYVATCTKHSFDRDYFHLLFVPWTAEFVVPNGVGEDTTITVLVDAETFGSGYWSKSVTFAGTAEPKPVITIKPGTSVTGFAALSITGYNNTRMIIPVDDSIVANDTWVVDCKNKTITKNGNAVTKYYGEFPKWIVGANTLIVEIGQILDESFTPTNTTGEALGVFHTTTIMQAKKMAQSFMVTDSDYSYFKLGLRLKKTGSPTGTMKAYIYTDNNGVPGSLVNIYDSEQGEYVSATFDIPMASLGAAFAWYEPEVASGANHCFTLSANTKYW